jgi:hypothetical protein
MSPMAVAGDSAMKRVNTYHFEDYLERANAAGSVEALFKVFVDTVKLHGIDRTIFSLSTEHNDIDAPAQLGLIHNYPSDWMKYYFENGFDRIDPVLIHASQKVGMFEWKEIPRYLDLRKKQRLCLNLGEEAGLHNGLGILMRGPCNQTAGIAWRRLKRKTPSTAISISSAPTATTFTSGSNISTNVPRRPTSIFF